MLSSQMTYLAHMHTHGFIIPAMLFSFHEDV